MDQYNGNAEWWARQLAKAKSNMPAFNAWLKKNPPQEKQGLLAIKYIPHPYSAMKVHVTCPECQQPAPVKLVRKLAFPGGALLDAYYCAACVLWRHLESVAENNGIHEIK